VNARYLCGSFALCSDEAAIAVYCPPLAAKSQSDTQLARKRTILYAWKLNFSAKPAVASIAILPTHVWDISCFASTARC
jgi:hypothetical protein